MEAPAARASTADFVDTVLAAEPAPGETVAFDADTVMSAGSREAMLRAAGGAVLGVDAGARRAGRGRPFVATRPPGHHAETASRDGFLLLRQRRDRRPPRPGGRAWAGWRWWISTCITATARRKSSTAEPRPVLWIEPSISLLSRHGRRLTEQGIAGNVVNAPLPPGAGGAAFRAAWSRTILPALDAFAPELLIISAGLRCAPRMTRSAQLRA